MFILECHVYQFFVYEIVDVMFMNSYPHGGHIYQILMIIYLYLMNVMFINTPGVCVLI